MGHSTLDHKRRAEIRAAVQESLLTNQDLRLYSGLNAQEWTTANSGGSQNQKHSVSWRSAITPLGRYWPIFREGRAPTIEIFCSTLHTNAARAFLIARNMFSKREISSSRLNLEVHFGRNSNELLAPFLKATEEKKPALISVTRGTKNKLLNPSQESDSQRFECLFQVHPAALHWAGPAGNNLTLERESDLSLVDFRIMHHPTDILCFQQFLSFVLNTNPANHGSAQGFSIGKYITEPPESASVFNSKKGGDATFLLTNPLFEYWATIGNKVGRIHLKADALSPNLGPSTKTETSLYFREDRYILANRELFLLRDDRASAMNVGRWLQHSLYRIFFDLERYRSMIASDWKALGLSEYVDHQILPYLGV